MITKDNSGIGIRTRFGPDWPGKRCGAKTRAGGICPKLAYKDLGRCHNHGGASTWPEDERRPSASLRSPFKAWSLYEG